MKITQRTLSLSGTAWRINYTEFLPSDYEERAAAGEKFPLVIFLHGSGERGDDHDLLTLHGWPHYALAGEDYPFVMIAPQCPDGLYWGCQIESLNRFLDGLLDGSVGGPAGGPALDPKRVYLTGLSMGGTGTFLWAMSDARRFAALVPVCGAGIIWGARELTNTPLWAFHGDHDECIDYHESVKMVEQINALGGHAKLTIYPGAGHGCWILCYQDPALIDWMMSQSL